MSHQVTPSRRKFRIAKEFAKELQKIYGNELLAVFVTGSVAANMALPESDIEIVIIRKTQPMKEIHDKRAEQIGNLIEKFSAGLKQEISVSNLTPESFKHLHKTQFTFPRNLGVQRTIGEPVAITQLWERAVPIFGEPKYLAELKEKGCFQIPNRQGAQRYLSRDVHRRIGFKHSKKGRQRFLPR